MMALLGSGSGAHTGHDGDEVIFADIPAGLVAARSALTGEHLAVYVGT